MKVKLIKADSLEDLECLVNNFVNQENLIRFFIDVSVATLEIVLDGYGSRRYDTQYISAIKYIK